MPLALLFSLRIDTGRQLALSGVNRFLNGSMSLDALRFSLGKGEFELGNASLKDDAGRELAGFDRLFFRISWTALRKGNLRLEELFLEKPRTTLRFDSQGRLSLVDIFSSPKPGLADGEDEQASPAGFPRNIEAENLHLVQGHLVMEWEAAGLSVTIDGIELSGSVDLAGLGADLDLRTGRALLDHEAIQADFAELGLQAALDAGQGRLALEGPVAGGSLAVQGTVGLAEVFPEGFLRAPANLDLLSYAVSAVPRGIRLESLLRSAGDLRGTVGGVLAASGRGVSLQGLSVSGTLDLTGEGLANSRFPDGMDVTLKAEAALDQGVAKWHKLEAAARELKLRSAGQLDLAANAIEASLFLDAAGLARTLLLLGMEGAGGSLRAAVSLSGPVKQPVFSCTAQARALRYREFTLGNLDLNAGLDGSGTLTLSRLTLRNQGSSLRGSGSVRIFDDPYTVSQTFPGKLTASFRNMRVRDFIRNDASAGTLKGDLRIEQDHRGLRARLTLQGRDLALEFAHLGDVDAGLRLVDGNLVLDSLEVRNRNSRLAARGSVRLLEKASFKPLKTRTLALEATGDPLYLEDFREGWHGSLALQARLKGRLERPEGTLRLDGKDLHFGFQSLAALELEAILEGQRVRLEPLRLTLAPGETVTCNGWVSDRKAYQLELVSDRLSLKNIDRLREQGLETGEASFSFSGAGTLENPRLDGTLRLSGLQAGEAPLGDIDMQIVLADGTGRISGNLGFDLNGSYDSRKKDFNASLLFNDADLAPLFVYLNQGELGARITGRVEARGNVGAMRRAEANADFSSVVLSYGQERVGRIQGLRAIYREERLSIPEFEFRLDRGGSMKVQAAVRPEGPFDLKASGAVPLKGLPPLISYLPDVAGDLDFFFQAGGTFQQPVVDGEVSFREVSFTVPELMQNMHHLEGKVRVGREEVTIESLAGRLDEGVFELGGKIDLDGFKPSGGRLTLKADSLPIKVPETLDVVLNADLRLAGTPEKSLVQGEILVLRGLYYRDVELNLLEEVTRRRRQEAPAARPLPQPLRNAALDVSLRARQAFSVENNLAEMEVRPDLRFAGTLSRPLLNGRAEVVSGTVTYQRKDFVIRKGVIDFLNPYKIEPSLDIRSEVKIRKWTILLNVSGTPDELTFELSSQPPEEQADVLSLILLGKTNQELLGGKAGGSGSTTQMLASILASSYGEEARKAAGLDILDVRSVEAEDETEQDRLKVTLGKRFSRRMTLKVEMETGGGETVQRAISEYRLLQNLLASGFQDTKGGFGGKILYRLEFR